MAAVMANELATQMAQPEPESQTAQAHSLKMRRVLLRSAFVGVQLMLWADKEQAVVFWVAVHTRKCPGKAHHRGKLSPTLACVWRLPGEGCLYPRVEWLGTAV